ncbi:MAG: pyruvate synthase subunit beta [Archaeoglobi archaeon]|nr:pyruvate synthase subunit beta [Candidatus Mnemosynella sp.]
MTKNEELLYKGTPACTGCGAALAARHVLRAAGRKTAVVIPASCMGVIAGVYPLGSFGVPTFHMAFAASAPTIEGISLGLEARGLEGNAIALAGDGATFDIGLAALSGALERGANFLYVCYDNEAYGNTGMQKSGATPFGASTSTTPEGRRGIKKKILDIVEAHDIPYVGTTSVGYPQDIYAKTKRALEIKGPKFLHILCTCPTGWRSDPAKTVELGRLAVQTGVCLMYERVQGKIRVSAPTKRVLEGDKLPVEEYLKLQGRFRHMSEEDIKIFQKLVDEEIEKLRRRIDEEI